MTGPGWSWDHSDSGASFGGFFEPHGSEPSRHPREEQEAGSHAPVPHKDRPLPWAVPD